MTRSSQSLVVAVLCIVVVALGVSPASGLSLWPTCSSPPGGDYALCARGAFPQAVAPGPDGAVWFTTARANLGRVTPAGGVTQYDVPVAGAPTGAGLLGGLTTGPDGAWWFPSYAISGLWRGTVADPPVFTYTAGGTTDTGPSDTVLGPDGALWSTEAKTETLGHFVVGGAFTYLALPPKAPGTFVSSFALANGSDGRIWVARPHAIDAVTTAGVVTPFTVPDDPSDLTLGPDGAIWFAEYDGDRIGRITTTGAVTLFALPADSAPASITTGPDGALWIGLGKDGGIMRMTTGGAWTVTPLPFSSQVSSITTGPDGAIWFGDLGGSRIGRLEVGPISGPSVATITPAFGAVGASVAISGHGLRRVSAVTVGGVPATFTAGSDTLIHATVPAGAGAAPIRVRTPAGTSAPTAASTFCYTTVPTGVPAPPPPAPPSAPTISLSTASLAAAGTLTVSVKTTIPGAFEAAAVLAPSGTKAHIAKSSAKFRLPRAGTAKGTFLKAGTTQVKVKLRPAALRALRGAGRSGTRVEVGVRLSLGGGQTSVGQRTYRLRLRH